MIPAAGAIPWRRRRGTLEVALVHRPRYDDWSWAKGKLDAGEHWPVAAVREVEEETGLTVCLGRPLPPSTYTVLGRDGEPATKEVRYWAAEITGGHGRLVNEIDEVVWLDVVAASARLDYARDRDQLRALVRADQCGTLDTWALAVVRHARAVGRSSWAGPDPLRPLDPRGAARARELVPLLAAYGVRRVVSSPSVRCADTVRPYADSIRTQLRLRPGLSEEGYAEDASRAPTYLTRLLERGSPAVLCSHGPVLPDLLGMLAAMVDKDEESGRAAAVLLADSADLGMGKGEVLVAHLVGRGPDARVVDVERHLP